VSREQNRFESLDFLAIFKSVEPSHPAPLTHRGTGLFVALAAWVHSYSESRTMVDIGNRLDWSGHYHPAI